MEDHHEKDRGRRVRTPSEIRDHINSDHPCCIGVGDAVALLHEIDLLNRELAISRGGYPFGGEHVGSGSR